MWKNVHPVSGSGILTHDFLDVSLHPWPLDQGSRPVQNPVSFNAYIFIVSMQDWNLKLLITLNIDPIL